MPIFFEGYGYLSFGFLQLTFFSRSAGKGTRIKGALAVNLLQSMLCRTLCSICFLDCFSFLSPFLLFYSYRNSLDFFIKDMLVVLSHGYSQFVVEDTFGYYNRFV